MSSTEHGFQMWPLFCERGEVARSSGEVVAAILWEGEGFRQWSYGPYLTHTYPSIRNFVSGLNSIALSAENGQIWNQGLYI
jgi:hypothetical protein